MRISTSSADRWKAGITFKEWRKSLMMVPGLEYLLNFLGNTGQWKHEQWKPEGATEADHENKKKSAAAFLKYLSSTMNHPVFQWCRIYQLEDVQIHTGETTSELVECICGLADWCGFPSDEGKERNIQYHFVCALSDSDLVCKLLALKLTATTFQDAGTMLHTHCHLRQHEHYGPNRLKVC